MKKQITPDFMWHLNEAVIAFQVAIVTTVDAEGRVNAAPFGLTLPFCCGADKPQMLLGSNSAWHTSQNIEATGEFVLNYASYGLMKQVATAGLMFDAGINEIEKAGLTAIPAVKTTPPRIEECYQHIECRLNRIIRPNEHQNNFIGDIVSLSLNESLAGKDRGSKMKTADPLFLFGVDVLSLEGSYGGIGKTAVFSPGEQDTHDPE